MATLNNKVKAFIVHGLATYMTPSEVVDAVKQEFDIEVTRQQVSSYDPYKAAGVNLSQHWKDMFDKFRNEFLDNVKAIPVANLAYRLRMLNDMAVDAYRSKNRVLTADLLKQAAEDVGGKYTNQQKVDSKVEKTGEINHKHSIDLPQNIADLNAQELAKLYFTKS